ncbi:DUF1177 domain-containing protein, partial [Haloferax volcanii]
MFDKIQQAYDILSRPDADGELVRDALETYGLDTEVTTISTDEGSTDFVKTVVPGRDPDAPTLGVVIIDSLPEADGTDHHVWRG